MRRALCTVTAIFLCLNMLFTMAAAIDVPTERIDYEDGSYAVITTTRGALTRAETADTKAYTYYNPSGQRCFSYTLYATFSYNVITSKAETVDYGVTIYRQGWDIDSHNEYTSGSTAYGEAVFSGPNGEERPVSLSLTCDRNGNVK